MRQITPHFNTREMYCKCPRCAGKIPPTSVVANLTKLAKVLEEFRSHSASGGIIVDCAYRCLAHNAEVGGVTGSFHTQGLAADIVFGDKKEADMFYTAAKIPVSQIPRRPGAGSLFAGVGYYPRKGFVHVDIAQGMPRPNTWKD